MEIRWDVLFIIIGGAIVTLLSRAFPLIVFSKLHIPEWGMRMLNYIPAAILSALLAQELLPLEDGQHWEVSHLLAAALCLAVGLLTRSLILTVGTGIGVVILYNLLH
ncbi:AzlD domain-containing protein [Siminovitchia sp. FSL H7-0308]|uniref:Branched-subunit amino acid transport protein n=1 Tax=Siminovitchia thermophila TaxID=1245522 RepID=A0ABS2R2E6_9BACI|nr:AzlD domain-containing protein [Siminovitchia thermophila]MBM7713550.1 branched-subunit amino acid transport protein [Siminovitchia thermophila]